MKPVEKRNCTGVLGDMIKKIEREEAYDKMHIASDYERSKKMNEAGVPVSYSDKAQSTYKNSTLKKIK